MNPETGHLIEPNEYLKRIEAEKQAEKAMRMLFNACYVEVPPELEGAARKKLAGRSEAFVSLTSGGKLSRWAAQQRKTKSRRRMARESRKRNRM